MKHVIRTTALVVLASLAMMATANGNHKQKTKKVKAKPAQELTLDRPTGNLGSMVGTWTLRDGDKPRTDIKMKFRSNGTFAFIGPNWQSAGTFTVQEHKLSLVWSSVDGQKVAAGAMHKDFPMADDDSSFTIDKYTYYKFSNN